MYPHICMQVCVSHNIISIPQSISHLCSGTWTIGDICLCPPHSPASFAVPCMQFRLSFPHLLLGHLCVYYTICICVLSQYMHTSNDHISDFG